VPATKLVPAAGTLERYRVQEMLGYINSEIHKTYSPLFNPKTSPELRADREAYLRKRYAVRSSRRDRTCSASSSPSPMRTCSPSPAGPTS